MGHQPHEGEEDNPVTIDHIVPLLYLRLIGQPALDWGGKPENLRASCRDANGEKGSIVLSRQRLIEAREVGVLNFVCPFDKWRGHLVWDWYRMRKR